MSKEGDVKHDVVDAQTEVKTTDGKSKTILPRGARHDKDVMVEISKREYRDLKKHRSDRHAFVRDCFCVGMCPCRMQYYRYGVFRGYVLPRMFRFQLAMRDDASPGYIPLNPVSDDVIEAAMCDSHGRCTHGPNLRPYDDRRDYLDHKHFYPTLVPNPTQPTPIQDDPPASSTEVVQTGSTGQGQSTAESQKKKNDACKKSKCWWIPVVIAVSVTIGFVLLIWIVASIAKASAEKKMLKERGQ